jgi:hypothetical protein
MANSAHIWSLYQGLEEFVLEQIKAGAPINGAYPPNAPVQAEYGVRRATHKSLAG